MLISTRGFHIQMFHEVQAILRSNEGTQVKLKKYKIKRRKGKNYEIIKCEKN